jgi:nucleoside-diphosphate-sugar epimerase
VDAYAKSKTLAERAAWDFVKAEGGSMELVTTLPVAVMGPIMGNEITGSNHIIQRILNAEMPGYPNVFIPIVDVRDVASAHLLAMTTPAAAGQRFLLSSGPALARKQIGEVLRKNLTNGAERVPTRSIPDIVVRIAAAFRKELRSVVPDLGYAKKTSSDKARRVLGWQARSADEAVIAAGESMVTKSLVKR